LYRRKWSPWRIISFQWCFESGWLGCYSVFVDFWWLSVHVLFIVIKRLNPTLPVGIVPVRRKQNRIVKDIERLKSKVWDEETP
jgi:hypothetical protein